MNSTATIIESWFIPFDIFMIVCSTLVIIFTILFLCIIISDKTCHTVPMMLTANSCLTGFVLGCSMLSLCAFMLQNDLKQIQYQDSLCIFRAYVDYGSYALFMYSFLLQSIYRYITTVYPNRFFWQSAKFQGLVILFSWIFSFVFPFAFVFTNEIIYNMDNQICQITLQLNFLTIYGALCIYIVPVSMINLIYLKLVLYVHGMNKRRVAVNILSRAQRELKMVKRIVILVTILITIGFPFATFVFISFFTSPPKYHFRIAFIFIDSSLVFTMLALFQLTEPLKTSIMKRIRRQPNMVARLT